MNPAGIGLGLTICNKILEQFESKLQVESIQGQGSTFYFILDIPWHSYFLSTQEVCLNHTEGPDLDQR